MSQTSGLLNGPGGIQRGSTRVSGFVPRRYSSTAHIFSRSKDPSCTPS